MAEQTTLYRIKVTLLGIEPPIWRTLETPDCNLYVLHRLIQEAMGWEDDHLWGFETVLGRFGPQRDAFTKTEPADRVTLAQLVEAGQKGFDYLYDFGDNWDHEIEIETVSDAAAIPGPRCLAGARACPPEDCGGVWGYQNLLEILADAQHPERAERLDWLGGEFDAEQFDQRAANALLQDIWHRRAELVLGEEGEDAGDFDLIPFPTAPARPTRAQKETKKKKRKASAKARKRNRGR
jgi:hypothetical protein